MSDQAADRPKSDQSKKSPTYDSKRLFNGAQIISIVHQGQVYQLRVTRKNKLILTK